MLHTSDGPQSTHLTASTITPPLIEAALARVLGSRSLRGSARGRRFLQFIVQEALAGRANRIKAYTIAMDVFDRDASFDPLLDPVVRIQAGRLRRALEHYYLTEGAADPLRIAIPKGGYAPQFSLVPVTAGADLADEAAGPAPGPTGERRHPPHATLVIGHRIGRPLRCLAVAAIVMLLAVAALYAGWRGIAPAPSKTVAERATAPAATQRAVRGPALLVLPFANGSGDPALDLVADGITEDVVAALVRFEDFLVFGADTSFRYPSAPALREAVPATRVDYMLKGSVAQTGDYIQVTATLIAAKDHRYLWSDSFRRAVTPARLLDLRHDIAVQVARTLAQSDGVIEREETRLNSQHAPQDLSSYACLLRARQYWRQLSASIHAEVRDCLERTTRSDPDYPEAWAALAMVTIDEARLGFNPSPARPDPIDDGLQMAERAVALAPDSALSHQALGLAWWLRREPQRSIEAYERALALNPNDSATLADLGRCYSLTGEWERGIPLIREAFARNPAQPSWYRIVIATYHYVHGRYADALDEMRRANLGREVLLGHVALAMIHGQTGNRAEAAKAVSEILRLDPNFPVKAVTEFERRNIHPDTIARIVDGLRKAGLAIPPPQTADGEGL
ncbi:TolB-like protein [Azospirillum brasilense]|uniref:TolB-like protein n=1 Tax=Azospirillum brasilense TaxID=192 RepID=A0A560CIV3_AZOBR|nr:tetratricopeptide repeat protein [Azospirillum brasilense]TWA84778.1 TolB-like protein [Azospirillum brasilense]